MEGKAHGMAAAPGSRPARNAASENPDEPPAPDGPANHAGPADDEGPANDAGPADDEARGEAEETAPRAVTRPGPGGSASRILDDSLHSDALPERARCPFCGEHDTEQFSAFGSAVSTSQYYCRRCRTVFEFMKRRGGS